jgi:hypothetical protein
VAWEWLVGLKFRPSTRLTRRARNDVW